MTKVHHQVSQSNWLDGRGLGEGLSKTPDKRSAKDCQIHLSVFPSLPLVKVGRFFHRLYLYSMIFRFSSPVPLIGWEVFHRLISCPVFLLSSPLG